MKNGRRRIRRGGRQSQQTVNVTIFHNPNGYNGKRASIGDLLDIVRPTVATFHLTAAVGHNQIKLKKLSLFSKEWEGGEALHPPEKFI